MLLSLPMAWAEEVSPDTIIASTPVDPPTQSENPYSITLEWQTTTYLLEKADTTLSGYTCDPTKTECKINPKITPTNT